MCPGGGGGEVGGGGGVGVAIGWRQGWIGLKNPSVVSKQKSGGAYGSRVYALDLLHYHALKHYFNLSPTSSYKLTVVLKGKAPNTQWQQGGTGSTCHACRFS